MTETAKPVRVRIAPSPTGAPHVGTAYIALFNRVFAHASGGKFILRIEDTDRARSTPESEVAILETLRWLGLTWDEGPDIGGPFGPYRQSERADIYRAHVGQLVDHGHAYWCFCASDRLDKMRKEQMAAGQMVKYDGACRSIPKDEVERRRAAGEPCVLRLRVPDGGEVTFTDLVRGTITIQNSQVDDQVLIKSDGFPTYHFANVVDDHAMQITHVMRAEEWISSTPKHVLLYRAFGWEMPAFAHLPLLRNTDKTKISKRKNPVSLTWYRAAGYLPEALVNFLALQGWTPKDQQDIFDTGKMEKEFAVDQVNTNAPIFDLKKLEWINGEYVRQLSPVEYRRRLALRAEAAAEYLAPLTELLQVRTKRLMDFPRWTDMFFKLSVDFPPETLLPKGGDAEKTVKNLKQAAKDLSKVEPATIENMEQAMRRTAESLGVTADELFMSLRVAVTGETASLPLFESIHMLGRDAAATRITDASGRLEVWRRTRKV